MSIRQIVWNGEPNRPLSLRRPCECGCDFRDGNHGVGYISGSDGDGIGFSIWIESETTFQIIERVMLRHGGIVNDISVAEYHIRKDSE